MKLFLFILEILLYIISLLLLFALFLNHGMATSNILSFLSETKTVFSEINENNNVLLQKNLKEKGLDTFTAGYIDDSVVSKLSRLTPGDQWEGWLLYRRVEKKGIIPNDLTIFLLKNKMKLFIPELKWENIDTGRVSTLSLYKTEDGEKFFYIRNS